MKFRSYFLHFKYGVLNFVAKSSHPYINYFFYLNLHRLYCKIEQPNTTIDKLNLMNK